MFRPRIIPVLLLKGNVLVKSVQFRKHHYIGDPINAVRLFNEFKADELVFLDIEASKKGKAISPAFIKKIGEEARMPFAVGGGITSIRDIKEAIAAGAEKVVIGTAAAKNPGFIREAANTFGSSAITVCIDVKKNFWGTKKAWISNGTKSAGRSPVELALEVEHMGAGELIVQRIEHDGMKCGYDTDTIKEISAKTTIPVVALGGASGLNDFQEAFSVGMASAVAAGSLFVYHGNRKGVLINYPTQKQITWHE